MTDSAYCSRCWIFFSSGSVSGPLMYGTRKPDDAVGDALVLEALDAVGGVGVVRDHVHLEVVAGVTLLRTDLGEPHQQPIELLAVTAGVHPTVAPQDGSTQGGVHVAADQKRDLLRGAGALLELVDLVEVAGVPEELTGCQPAQDVHALVHALAALGPVDSQVGEVLGPGRDADAEAEAVARQERQRRGLLGHQHRRAHGQLEHERRETQRRGDGEEVGAQDHALDELLAVEELPVAGVGVGVLRVRVLRIDQGVGHRHGGVAGCFHRLRQGRVVVGLGHCLCIGETHNARVVN